MGIVEYGPRGGVGGGLVTSRVCGKKWLFSFQERIEMGCALN